MAMDEQQQPVWDWDLLSEDENDEGGKQQHLYSMPMLVYTKDYFICPHPPLSKPTLHEGESMVIWNPVSQVSFNETDQVKKVESTSPAAVMPWIEDDNFHEKVGSSGGGLKIWKWGLSGIGAICSFGVATLCIAIFSSHGQAKNHPHINFKNQICSKHHEIVMGGVPMTAAQITFGGYYNSPLYSHETTSTQLTSQWPSAPL